MAHRKNLIQCLHVGPGALSHILAPATPQGRAPEVAPPDSFAFMAGRFHGQLCPMVRVGPRPSPRQMLCLLGLC